MNTSYREFLARQIIDNNDVLALEWLDSLKSVVLEDASNIFPTEQYLDHIPMMISEIGNIIRDKDAELALFNSLITRKALELGNLRHEQNATVSQLLREYDLLAQHLEAFLTRTSADYTGTLDVADMMDACNTLHSIVRRVLQDTVDSFVSKYVATIEDQTEKLLHFNNFVGHEIRTPLQTALLNVELILDDDDNFPQPDESLVDVKNAIEQVITIVNNVQMLVSPSDVIPTDTPVTQKICITSLANDIANQFEHTLDEQAIDLIIPDELGVISTDTGKLRLILSNLLSNAIKYSDPQRTNSFVRLSRQEDRYNQLTIAIEDNGIGISAEQLSRVTELKVRAYENESHKAPIEGHGLGLYLVNEAVNFLEGQLSIESTESVGTTVIVSLPERA